MSNPNKFNKFQDFLDRHVRQGTAAGLQGVVFDKGGIVFNGSSGLSCLSQKDSLITQKPMTTETHHWLASCSKLIISILVLQVVEKGYGNQFGFTLNSLDDHEALIRVLPEFDHSLGQNVTKIITGFKENEKDSEGKKIPILRPSTNKVTLRQLLSHTTGLAYYFDHELMKEWYEPSDESTPNGTIAFISGLIKDFQVPLVFDGGKEYIYGPNTDWLGQFIIRLTGKNLRDSFMELFVKPLEIPENEMDMMISKLKESNGGDENYNHANPMIRNPTFVPTTENQNQNQQGIIEPPEGAFIEIQLPLYEPKDVDPPKGYAHFASANIHSSLYTYAKVLHSCLIKDERLLSKQTWDLIQKDDITPRGIVIKEISMPSHMQNLVYDVKHYFDVDHEKYCINGVDTSAGWNLLQSYVAKVETNSGLSPTSFSWAGLGNTYWFIDPIKGIGAVFGTQLYPFYDPQMIKARYEWEALVTSTMATNDN